MRIGLPGNRRFNLSASDTSTTIELLEMVFQLNPFVSGITTLTLTITDDGKPQVGNPKTSTIEVVMTVTPVNDAPTVSTVYPMVVDEDSSSSTLRALLLSLGPYETTDSIDQAASKITQMVFESPDNQPIFSTPTLQFIPFNNSATVWWI